MLNEESITGSNDPSSLRVDTNGEEVENSGDFKLPADRKLTLYRRLLANALFTLSQFKTVFSERRRKRFLSSAAKRNPAYKVYIENEISCGFRSIEDLQLFDADWYASKHGLSGPNEAIEHYKTIGILQCLSPHPYLAGLDGVKMDNWGAEYLLRLGVKLGELGKNYPGNKTFDIVDPFSIKNNENKSLAVVTAIFGSTDRLLPVDQTWSEDADFYLFSDLWYENRGLWKSVNCNFDHPDSRRRARFVKTHLPTYFSCYDWVIWVDGNVLICVNPKNLVSHLVDEKVDFATFKHPERTNLISEAAACVKFKKEDPTIVAKHLRDSSHRLGFNEEILFETMVCAARPREPEVRSLYARWWTGIMRGSKRDQLSLPLAISEHPNLSYGYIPHCINKSSWFAKTGHVDE